jgi:hypothetical protein
MKETYLAAQYHRLAAKRGRKRAIMVVAHLFAQPCMNSGAPVNPSCMTSERTTRQFYQHDRSGHWLRLNEYPIYAIGVYSQPLTLPQSARYCPPERCPEPRPRPRAWRPQSRRDWNISSAERQSARFDIKNKRVRLVVTSPVLFDLQIQSNGCGAKTRTSANSVGW